MRVDSITRWTTQVWWFWLAGNKLLRRIVVSSFASSSAVSAFSSSSTSSALPRGPSCMGWTCGPSERYSLSTNVLTLISNTIQQLSIIFIINFRPRALTLHAIFVPQTSLTNLFDHYFLISPTTLYIDPSTSWV